MIPTKDKSGEMRMGFCHRPVWKLLTLLPMLVLLNACTNSKLVIGPLYNQLDNQMRKEFNKLGDFNAAQKDAFEQAVGTFHVWHRQSEMPQYAALTNEIAAAIATADNTQASDVQMWVESAESFSRSARECHPINFSFDLMKSMTDKQITFVEERFKRERTKNREKYEARTPDERVERRLNKIGKWAGRIDLDISANQRSLLRQTLVQQTSLRKEYYELSDEWNRQLFTIARNQEASNYDAALNAHLIKLWTLLETTHPVQWRKNRELWQGTAFKFIQSLSAEQRSNVAPWLSKMADTILAISKDTPSFVVGNDASVGCLSEEAKS